MVGQSGLGEMETFQKHTGAPFALLQQLYPSYPSSRKLAARLGASHTMIANRLRQFGLPEKSGR